jgi:O-antigen ligase
MERLLLAGVALSMLWRGGKGLEATWGMALLGGVMTFVRWSRTPSKELLPFWLWGGWVLFFLWTVASLVASTTRTYGLDEVLRDGAGILLMLWVFQTLRKGSSEFPRRFSIVLSWSLLGACVIGVVVYILQPVDRFVGTFFDARFHTDYWPNAWAELVLLVWPFLLLWLFGRRRPIWAVPAVLGVVGAAFLLSYSRGALLSLLLQAGILSLLRWCGNGRASLPLPSLKPALAAVGVALALVLGCNLARGVLFPVQSFTEKATFNAQEGKSSINERASFWRQAVTLSLERPILGWGPYSFRFVQPPIEESVLATSDHPHNVILKITMERGIIAGLLFTLLIAATLIASFKKAWMNRETREMASQRTLRTAALVSAIGVLAHSMLDYNLQFVAIALPLWIVLGILLALDTAGIGDLLPSALYGLRSVTRMTEVALAMLILLVAILEGRTLAFSSLARHAEAAGNSEEALMWYEKAKDELFSRDMMLSRTHLLLDAGRTEEARAVLEAGMKENAEDARAWELKGAIAECQGLLEDAREAYAEAWRRNRYNELSPLRSLLRVAKALDDRETFKTVKPQAEEIIGAFADAIRVNAHFSALGDNVEDLLALLPFLQELSPARAGYYAEVRMHVEEASTREREKLISRPLGQLW